ncbi:MAG: hemerythrin domain-containing protein [Sphingomonas sp.]|uniref:hemerythrin domain-containing protein n=1 Tax=Sphingomonas sp. TaxID=28214 RepID=UPI0018373FB4|nr:hemerythrin domain-containing protein [Sphingomonas sp.]MBA3666665.1 hemerythrin domain-containing protein [Sphingomonas sp.]
MARTDPLRHQHGLAAQIVSRIIDKIDHYSGPDDAYRISLDLSKLLGLLRTHLAQEDVHFYPAMIQSGDPQAGAAALSIAMEMGDLAERFERFAARWSSSAVIAARFDRFRYDALTIFAKLEARIRRENEELYPLADRLADALRTAA